MFRLLALIAVGTATVRGLSCPAEANLTQYLSCMRHNADGFMKLNIEGGDFDARKEQLAAVFSKFGCEIPDYDAELGSSLPSLFKKILNKVKEAFNQASPAFKGCFNGEMRQRIMDKLGDCLGFSTEKVATHIPVFEPISMPEEEYILQFFTRLMNIQSGVRECKEKVKAAFGVTGTVAPFPGLECADVGAFAQPPKEVEDAFAELDSAVFAAMGFRQEICDARDSCATGPIDSCIDEVQGNLCKCTQQRKTEIRCEIAKVSMKEGLEVNDLIKTFGQVDSMKELGEVITKCHRETTGEAELPKDIRQLILMAEKIAENPNMLKLRFNGHSSVTEKLKAAILDFLSAFAQESVACYQC